MSALLPHANLREQLADSSKMRSILRTASKISGWSGPGLVSVIFGTVALVSLRMRISPQ